MAVPEVWLDVLCDTPILFLRLLQTNKALNTLWSRIPDTWRRMTARLVEMELGGYMGQVYPFFVVENERIFAQPAYSTTSADYIDRERYAIARGKYVHIAPELGIGSHELFSTPPALKGDETNEHYYYVAYDEYTSHFISALQHLINFSCASYRKTIEEVLRKYLGLEGLGTFVACYLDGFLVTRSFVNEIDGTAKFTYPTDMKPLFASLADDGTKLAIEGYKVIMRIEETEGPDPFGKLALLATLEVATKPPKAIKLDAKTIGPYYEKLLALYANEPQREKTFFLRLLNSFVPHDDDYEKTIKYGGDCVIFSPKFTFGAPSEKPVTSYTSHPTYTFGRHEAPIPTFSLPNPCTSTQSPRPSTLPQAWKDDDTRTPAMFNFGRPSQEYDTQYPRPFTFGQGWRDSNTQKPTTFNFGRAPQNEKRTTTTASSDGGDNDTCTRSPLTFSFSRPLQEYDTGTQSPRQVKFGQDWRDNDTQKPATFNFGQAQQNDTRSTTASLDDNRCTESPRTFFFGPLYQ